jgi:hypothetical protein
MTIRYFVLALLILTSSCDCFIKIKGTVISSSTGKPIEGALVEMMKQDKTVTDSLGRFLVAKHTGFCFDPILLITKPKYKPFKIKIETKSKTIRYSITYDSESFDFNKPIYPDTTNKKTFIVGSWIEKYSRNFQVRNDSLFIYLDDSNPENEKETIKNKIKNSG